MCVHDPTQTSLDCSYSCSHHTDGTQTADEVIHQFVSKLEECYKSNKAQFPVIEDISYGEGEKENFDVWGEKSEKMIVVIHGGYWQEGDRKYFTSSVAPLVKKGFRVVILGYEYASEENTLSSVIQNVTKVINAALGMFPETLSLYIVGHSAGAHLAFKAAAGMNSDKLKGICLMSGVYYLEELVETYVGRGISLTPEEALKCSCSATELEEKNLRILFLSAEFDAPSLLKQEEKMEKELRDRGMELESKKIPGVNHFTIVENLGLIDSPQTEAIVDFCS